MDVDEIDALKGVDNVRGRSLDQVTEIAEYAKLKQEELKNQVQVLSFASDFADHKVTLVELDDDLLDHLTKGQSLTFRGGEADHAVLCTQNRTYAVKEAETSNSLLLLHHLACPQSMTLTGEKTLVHREVVSVHHTYLELTPCKPRLQRVRHLLGQNPYMGHEYEGQNPSTKYTLEDLDCVQASDVELRTCLKDTEAYYVDGFWRLLDFDYRCRLLTHILNLLEENSWNYRRVPRWQVLETLQELEPRPILEQCFDYYATKLDVVDQNGNALYMLNENKICRFYAEMMLKPTGKFNLQDFSDAWQQCIPNGMTAGLEQLDSMALIDRSCRPAIIAYLPVWDMPEDVDGRFNFLFKTRPKWNFEDICPFIKDLTTKNLDVNGLLSKYARMSMVNGVRCYTSKRPVY